MPYRDHPVRDVGTVVDADTQFVDVRRPEEYATGTLDGAVNLPLEHLAEWIGQLDARRRVVLVCRSGNRSGQAAEQLDAAGFVDVINLAGGMLGHAQGDS